jgi:hypothetical protein
MTANKKFFNLLTLLKPFLLNMNKPIFKKSLGVYILLLCFHFGYSQDWLVKEVQEKAKITIENNKIELNNGLLRRQFLMKPNLACYDFLNLSNNQQLLRAIKPEARIRINGKDYEIGGLSGQNENAYIKPEILPTLKDNTSDFVFKTYEITDIKSNIKFKERFWPYKLPKATGKTLILVFTPKNEALKGLEVLVNYELYDGLPLIVKFLTIKNLGEKTFRIDRVTNEILGLVEEESAVVGSPEEMKKQHGIYVETNYAFNNAMRYDISDQTTHWKIDSTYTSQVNYYFQTPCLLEIYPEKAPGIDLKPNDVFHSVRTHELLMDSYDRQRRGLMIKKMYRTVAPWTIQNPIFMHLVSKNDEEVKTAIDQCHATGYEAVILSFGSHLNMEDESDGNYARWKSLADYAHSKNIFLGGYSLFSSRKISDEHDVISPITGKPGGAFFGNAPCFGSQWGLDYSQKIKRFFEKTGFDIWENDGPYPGDVCASTVHPGHRDLEDSQWMQMEIQKELYRWLNEKGVYINAPDWYFLDGTHKIGIGYREVNFSLPRDQQRILNRQNIHDGTIEKTGAMSWGFVPLTRYQGGGPEAVLEPLEQHLEDYEQLMIQYYGAGVQACYRGPRLFDTETTRKTVEKTILWYKKYRDILNSDMIQLRRADGRDWDGFLHVNPNLSQKGFLILFNPTQKTMIKKIKVPLYYTGLSSKAILKEQDKNSKTLIINRNFEIEVDVTIPANSYNWYVIE